jgi:DNA-binding transcriptional LysR family regulator
MEMRHLQTFIALAEEGTFTAAARKINVVRSGISVTIKEMEQELGVQPVNRTTRKVSLTHAGERFGTDCGSTIQGFPSFPQGRLFAFARGQSLHAQVRGVQG